MSRSWTPDREPDDRPGHVERPSDDVRDPIPVPPDRVPPATIDEPPDGPDDPVRDPTPAGDPPSDEPARIV